MIERTGESRGAIDLTVARQLERVEALERALGDPAQPDALMSFKTTVGLDDRESFPEEAVAALDRFGLQSYYIPPEAGGRLDSFQSLCHLLACVARRDLTAAVAHSSSFLGALPVWIGGSGDQKVQAAEVLREGGAIAFGMTEREHGSDLSATETRAVATGSGWRLDGEKWLINNATRAWALSVFARTGDPGPRGFSLFFVEKSRLPAGACEALPKVPTLGIRGADISGVRFRGCDVGPDALIGAPGSGLELAMKSLQVSRTLVPSLALGLAETALRTTLAWARRRRLYGAPILDIPHVRSTLAEAYLDYLTCDALLHVAARGLHVTPEQQSLCAAVVKSVVPATIEEAIRRLAIVLGSRHFLRTGHDGGIFQKILREVGLIALFDGSTVINLGAVALQMPRLARARRSAHRQGAETRMPERLARRCDPFEPLPPFDPLRLTLGLHGQDEIASALFRAEEWIETTARTDPIDPAVADSVGRSVRTLTAALDRDDKVLLEAAGWGSDMALSAEGFDLAWRYCQLHAASACLLFWLHARRHLDGFWREGRWVAAALARLGTPVGRADRVANDSVDLLVEELLDRERAGRLFNSLGFAIPSSTQDPEETRSR